MKIRKSLRLVVCIQASLLLLSAFTMLGASSHSSEDLIQPNSFVWMGPDKEPLPFQSYTEIEEFLLQADVISKQVIPVGVTKPEKLLLEKDNVRMYAVFRTVDIFKQQWMSKEGMKLNFRDHYRFESAAYELGKLLGLKNIPPVVLRTIGDVKGSLQAWVEGSMTEQSRKEKRLAPPRSFEWIHQLHFISLFDNLINNDDRNQGNILIDENWHLWMIDATRAFRIRDDLINPNGIRCCPKDFWQRLKALKEEDLEAKLLDTDLLTSAELDTLLKRRLRLLEFLSDKIETEGEQAVLIDKTW